MAQLLYLGDALQQQYQHQGQQHRDLDVQFDQGGKAVDGFSEVDGFGVQIDFFDFCVGTHHEVQAPERNREHSIGDQMAALNVEFMERLPFTRLIASVFYVLRREFFLLTRHFQRFGQAPMRPPSWRIS